MSDQQLFSADALTEWGRQILLQVGVPDDEARLAADVLVEANLRGVDTHGIYLLNLYSRRLKAGLSNPTPQMKFEKTRAGTGILDADTALGQLATVRAMDHAMELAREAGTGTVIVKRSTHFGAGAYYTEHAAKNDMIGILMCHGETDVVLFGGQKPFLGTNPYSVAIPAGKRRAFVMDMATSEAAAGKVRAAREGGRSIPPNWAVDEFGNPVTDPNKAKAVVPMAGAKGYAIGMMIEIFSSILSGMAYGPGIVRKFDDWENPQALGYFVQAIDPTAFVPIEEFKARMDELIEEIKTQPAAESNPFGRILIPGEPEHDRKAERLKEGCPLAEEVIAQLRELGKDLGAPFPG
jgi:ureidoglycolate dehydrogenase (NAD+)